MYLNKEYVDQAMPERRRGQVGMFYILIDKPENSSRIAEAVDAAFRNSTAQTKTESEQAFTVGFLSLLGNVKMFLIGDFGRGDVHHSAGLGEHHGDVGARARARSGSSEDAGLYAGHDSAN